MSVTHLEDFVQMMVRSSDAEKAVDSPKWRETLQRLVTRCYRSKPRRRHSGGGDRYNQMSISNAIQLANSVVSEYSPVVSLCDVLKFKPREDNIQQDQFLQYFGLNLNNNQTDQLRPNKEKYSTHHPRNLINTPQVPFSSDLGMKLIKERPGIPREIHERKIERLERYLQVIPKSDDVLYEVIYNKTIDLEDSHVYTFPTRTFHDKNKLTPKARHLLKKYCKPCSVKLPRLDTKKLERFAHLVDSIENSDKDQKENIQLLKNKGISESRVVLTDNFLNPSLKTLPVRRTNFLTNKPIPKTSDNTSRRTRQQNFSKTLTPRNENTMGIKINGGKNLVNACVVLQPINNFIEVKRNSSPSGTENTIHTQKGRVLKKQVNTYYPRRFSARLKIVNKPLIL